MWQFFKGLKEGVFEAIIVDNWREFGSLIGHVFVWVSGIFIAIIIAFLVTYGLSIGIDIIFAP